MVFHMAIRILFHSVKCQSFTKNVLIAFVFPRLKVKFLSTGFKVLYILAVLYLSNFLPIFMPSHLLYSHPDLFSISPTLQDLSLEPVHWKFKIIDYFLTFNSLLIYHQFVKARYLGHPI